MSKVYWVIALDLGFRKTGIAVGQSLTKTAKPLKVIYKNIGALTVEDFALIIKEWHIETIVIGRPEHQDKTEHPLHAPINRIARELAVFNLPIHFVSEYLTSHEAHQRLGNKAKNIDAMAAAVIAEDFLSFHN